MLHVCDQGGETGETSGIMSWCWNQLLDCTRGDGYTKVAERVRACSGKGVALADG